MFLSKLVDVFWFSRSRGLDIEELSTLEEQAITKEKKNERKKLKNKKES